MYALLTATDAGYAINIYNKDHSFKYGMMVNGWSASEHTIKLLKDLRIKNVEVTSMSRDMIDDMRDANLVLWASMQSKIQY